MTDSYSSDCCVSMVSIAIADNVYMNRDSCIPDLGWSEPVDLFSINAALTIV